MGEGHCVLEYYRETQKKKTGMAELSFGTQGEKAAINTLFKSIFFSDEIPSILCYMQAENK